MPNLELMPIGVFARRTGLTSSALRFYADSGLLPPARTDPVTGYRHYGADQVARAVELRRLREIAMPLSAVEAVLDAEPDEASRLIDEHVGKVVEDAEAVRRKAALIKSSLADVPSVPIAALKGPVLADAIEQVLTATACDPGMPVLGGLRFEAAQDAVTLTATDRYRLATRTLVPVEPAPSGIRLRTTDGNDQYCRLLSAKFPDHRLMLASLSAVTTRVTVRKDLLLRAMEQHAGGRLSLCVTRHGLKALAADDEHPGFSLPAAVTGRTPLQISFELTTLYPAVSTAIGSDVMLDLRGTDRPVTVRSADRGDLTTLAMPVGPDRPA